MPPILDYSRLTSVMVPTAKQESFASVDCQKTIARGDRDRDAKKAIGTFYVQFAGSLVAYDLPGGAISMTFTNIDLKPVPDGQGGTYLIGTADLDITEATGVYESFCRWS